MVRIASPASPAAATRVVASTATDPVTSDAPAVASGATNGVQLSVPRSISVSDVHCVVTPEDSMKSRNGGLIRPSSTSATTHHAMASTEHSAHHAVNRSHNRFGRWQAHQMSAARQPVRVATALTAPIRASASADRAASSRTEPSPRSARDDRQQHPRRQHHRQRLRRDRANRGQHARRQRECGGRDDPRNR